MPPARPRWNVVIPDRLSPPADIEAGVFGKRARISVLRAASASQLRGRIEDADAILAWHELQWDRPLLESLRRCRVLVRVGVGYDNVDLAAAAERGIAVCNVPDYGTNDVADHAMALLLGLARGLPAYARALRSGSSGWRWDTADTFRLTGRRLGLIGLGRIGTAVALRAKSFGMEVFFYDPYKPSGWEKTLGVVRCRELKELAARSEIVSLHAPLTAETAGMIDDSFYRALRAPVVLINTARGGMLDWPAFRKAFRSGRVACAGLDVLSTEPMDRRDPLLAAWLREDSRVRDRLILTPHCAFYSEEAYREMRSKAAAEALRVLEGKAPLNQVN